MLGNVDVSVIGNKILDLASFNLAWDECNGESGSESESSE